MLAEESKRRTLLQIIYQLENDKRQLETAMVVEGRSSGVRRRSARSAVAAARGSMKEGESRGGVGGALTSSSLQHPSLEPESAAGSEGSGEDPLGRDDRQESLGFAEEGENTDDVSGGAGCPGGGGGLWWPTGGDGIGRSPLGPRERARAGTT